MSSQPSEVCSPTCLLCFEVHCHAKLERRARWSRQQEQLVVIAMAARGGMGSSEQQRVCRQHGGDRRGPSCHSRKLKRKSLEEEFYFAHQTIENRSKEEPKGFVGADSS